MANMRGPFPFPPGGPQTTGSAGEVMLQSGGVYVLPPGEWLLVTGQQTVLQWQDPNNQSWRCYAQSGEFTTVSSDGSNYRLVNMSGVINGANISNAGSGGVNGIGPNQTGSTVTFPAPAAGGVTETAQGYVIVGGSVQAPTVSQGGSGFLVPPLILIDPPPTGGIQATATATLSSAGVITGITMVNVGAGYTSTPNFYIVPQFQFYSGAIRFPGDAVANANPTGTMWAPGLIHPNNVFNASPYQGNISSALGALLTPAALTGSGTLTGIVVTQFGGGYTAAISATLTFGGVSLGAAAATALFSFCLIGGTVTATGGTGFTVGNPIITGLGLVQSTFNNSAYFPKPGRGLVTNAAGPVFSIEDPGFGIQKSLATNFGEAVNGTAAPTAAGTIPTSALGGTTDVSVLQPMVQ